MTTLPATPRMATRGSSAAATGIVITMISVGAGVSSASGFALLLSFAGVLTGSSLIFVGVRLADDPDPPTIRSPWVLAAGVVRELVHCLRRNRSLLGLLLASAAATAAADRETAPVLCFSAFVFLLLGLSLLNVGVLPLGEQDQEH